MRVGPGTGAELVTGLLQLTVSSSGILFPLAHLIPEVEREDGISVVCLLCARASTSMNLLYCQPCKAGTTVGGEVCSQIGLIQGIRMRKKLIFIITLADI